MNRRWCALGLAAWALLAAAAPAGSLGLTASCLFPRGGRFSHPVSPLSLRELDFRVGRHLELSGDLSLYSLRGLGLEDPEGRRIELDSPPVGPALSVLGCAGAFLVLPVGEMEITAGGGLFGCWLPQVPLQADPIEAYLAAPTSGDTYEALSAAVSTERAASWGGGAFLGGGLTWLLKGQIALGLEVRYYFGSARLGLTGSYDAYDADAALPVLDGAPLPAALRQARIDLNALELLLGVSLRL